MCFDLEKMAVPIENRSVALGVRRLAHFISLFANNVRMVGPIGMGGTLIDVF